MPQSKTSSISPAQSSGRCAWPWQPDCGNGRYRNPIICADYSDPDVVRHGSDFFMTASSFNCTPGLPILHSKDLVNWKLINHALRNVPDKRYSEVQPGCGVWAPAIRHHAGKFWIFFPTPDEGIYVTTAEDPAAEWSEPHLVQAGKGLIDPCPLWDDDGQAFLVHAYAGSRAGIKHRLRVCPMAPDASHLLGEGQIVFYDPERHPTLEGPKFLKKDSWYYILAPAGGVETGWQVVLRSRNIYGPYEDKVVLEQGSTCINGPHQGALVDTPDGNWWFVHFQDAGLYGRITHLQPVRWQDDWPLMGTDQNGNGVGEPVAEAEKPMLIANAPRLIPDTSDEFDKPKLGLQWQWNANHDDSWSSLRARPGWLRLSALPAPNKDLSLVPHLLLQKFPAREFGVEAKIDLKSQGEGVEAGLVIMGRDYAALAVRREGSSSRLILHLKERSLNIVNCDVSSIRLRVHVANGGLCEFAYAPEGIDFRPVETKFQTGPGVWIGARVGLYALALSSESRGHADFEYFRFGPGQNPQ